MSRSIVSQKLATMQKLRETLSNLLDIRTSDITPEASIADLGIDSLMSHEVARDLGKRFGVVISGEELIELDDMERLCERLVASRCTSSRSSSRMSSRSSSRASSPFSSCPSSRTSSPAPPRKSYRSDPDDLAQSLLRTGLVDDAGVCEAASQCMAETRAKYDTVVHDAGFTRFFNDVQPLQQRLVLAYVVEAFSALGCDLSDLSDHLELPAIRYQSSHSKVVQQYYLILEKAGLIVRQGDAWIRSALPLDLPSSDEILADLVHRFPRYASEHLLSSVTGSKLAACLCGESQPVDLLFNNADSRALLEDYYANSPYLKAGTSYLTQYLVNLSSTAKLGRPLRILEIGSGTGGTTAHVLRTLASTGQKFDFTFSDISPSFVAAGRKRFAHYDFVNYKIIDIEKAPPADLEGHFDVVFSTNSVHATTNVVKATQNIKAMLRNDGVLCLLEMMQSLPWFDVVFGLLEGWWLFEDGRKYALIDEGHWDQCLTSAGYRWIDWSRGDLTESSLLRLLVASPSPRLSPVYSPAHNVPVKSLPWKETLTFKKTETLALEADIYYPRELQSSTSAARPIALMIHGGGHIMLSRHDIRPQQTANLIKAGFLPISIDYRLCPEVNVLDGPMADVRDAYIWIQKELESASRQRTDVKIDTSRVVVVGWSSGGHLAMSLGWTLPTSSIPGPRAILAFYCQTDYEDCFWERPNIPRGSEDAAKAFSSLSISQIRAGVSENPIASYDIPSEQKCTGGMMNPDNLRSRIALWANWTGKQRQILLQGLPRDGDKEDFSELCPEQVRAISPKAQVDAGVYTTPTFLIHGTEDDLIPWQQTKATYQALASHGIDADCRIVQGAEHIFDAVPGWQDDCDQSKAVWDGYDFLKRHAVQ